MRMKIPYDKSKADLDAKRAEHEAQGKVLIEVQNHEDGDFLVFGDKPSAPAVSTDERLKAIEARLMALEKGKV